MKSDEELAAQTLWLPRHEVGNKAMPGDIVFVLAPETTVGLTLLINGSPALWWRRWQRGDTLPVSAYLIGLLRLKEVAS
jgi:hypothetical protein